MTYISLQNKLFKNFLVLAVLLNSTSCGFIFRKKDPVNKVNRKFLHEYGHEVKKARKKHKKEVGKNVDASFEEEQYLPTSRGTKAKKSGDSGEFDYGAMENNDGYIYAVPKDVSVLKHRPEEEYARRRKPKKVKYVLHNYASYEKTAVDFDDVRIPRNKLVSKEELKNKRFNKIESDTMQESFDHLDVIQQRRKRKLRELKIRKKQIEKQRKVQEAKKKKGGSIVKKATGVVKSLKDRILELLK